MTRIQSANLYLRPYSYELVRACIEEKRKLYPGARCYCIRLLLCVLHLGGWQLLLLWQGNCSETTVRSETPGARGAQPAPGKNPGFLGNPGRRAPYAMAAGGEERGASGRARDLSTREWEQRNRSLRDDADEWRTQIRVLNQEEIFRPYTLFLFIIIIFKKINCF